MPVNRERNDTTNEVRLEGRVNIESASELKALLIEELSAGTDLSVVLAGVTELDVCILQLLLSAEREWTRIGSSLTFVGPAPREVAASIANAGFDALNIASDRIILSEV